MNMKTIKYLFFAVCLVLLNVSCEREYMAPPLSEPTYEGPSENISIQQLKARYASITDPVMVEDDLIVRAVVSGNDESGNIYKQLYVQDESAGINIGVDQNAIFGVYQVGQEVYIHLKDLYMVKYGGELQIGMGSTAANRIPWEVFQEVAQPNSWANAENAKPRVVTLDKLTEDMVNTLVEIHDVRFVNGGKNTFATGDATTNETLTDAAGHTLDVRNSNFSDFAKDLLPTGNGTVVGMLGRFNGGWQLFLRTRADVKDFDGQEAAPEEPEEPTAGSFFKETFGSGYYPSGNRPKINDFTDFDMKAPVTYSDASGVADIRSISGDNGAHIWLPAAKDATIKITGIQATGQEEIGLKFQLAANLFDPGTSANINNIQLKVNGTVVALPNQALSNEAGDNGRFVDVVVPNLPASDKLTLEFVSSATSNLVGFRLDNIELFGASNGESGSGEPIIVTPDN